MMRHQQQPQPIALSYGVACALVGLLCLGAKDCGEDTKEALDLKPRSRIHSAPKGDIEKGGGVFITNTPGGFYMGRLRPGDIFDFEKFRHPKSGLVVDHYTSPPKENDGRYYWGTAYGDIGGTCAWLGPSHDIEGNHGTYFVKHDPVPIQCKGKADLLKDAHKFGREFNCEPHEHKATFGSFTRLKRKTYFHHNLNWRSDYTGGPPVGVGKPLKRNQGVYYRYTTINPPRMSVVYVHPKDDPKTDDSYGWGFVPASAVPHHEGDWGPGDTRCSCNEPHKDNCPSALKIKADGFDFEDDDEACGIAANSACCPGGTCLGPGLVCDESTCVAAGSAQTWIPVDRMFNIQTGDHDLSFGDYTPPSDLYVNEGPLPPIANSGGPGLHPLYLCRTKGGCDGFVSLDAQCEGEDPSIIGAFGYLYDAPQPGARAVYRCRVVEPCGLDRMVSEDPNCEGQMMDITLGYSF